jgi:hypothetical protein
MSDTNYEAIRAEIQSKLDALDLGIVARFVPWSKSRNAKPNPRMIDRSLNWSVDIKHRGQTIMTVDYTQGIGCCPSYTARDAHRPTIHFAEAIAHETETGTKYFNGSVVLKGKRIELHAVDVFSSVFMDTDVLDYASYEDYAASLGLDPDSRKGEASYRECLRYALTLRAVIGNRALTELRELSHQL